MRPLVAGLVSVIIPVRNRPVLLGEAVRSVLAQSYRSFEIIIIDDGSTDDTLAAAQSIAARHSNEVRVLQQAARGVATARNTGLAAAAGEFVQFLDSDDLLMPEKFARQVEGLRQHPECGISYCLTREYRIGERWSGLPSRRTGACMEALFPHLLTGRIWAAPSPLYRREVVEINGPMREWAIYEDWEYEGRAASRSVRLHHCDEYLADKRDTHRLSGGQKGGTRPHKLKDYAAIHLLMHRYACDAGVAATDLDRYATKLFAAARLCADGGLADEARQLLSLARQLALGRWSKARLSGYEAVSERAGWQRTGRWSTRIDRSSAVAAIRQLRAWPSTRLAAWRHRWDAARAITAGRPVVQWPQLLSSQWAARQSRHRST